MLSVRNVEPTDRPLLDRAAEADIFHKAAGLTGAHWAKDSILYEDEFGPVVALKTRNVVRVDIQFIDPQDSKRNAKALAEGFMRYVQVLISRRVTEIICHTNSPPVAKFLEDRFRFKLAKPGTYSLYIGE